MNTQLIDNQIQNFSNGNKNLQNVITFQFYLDTYTIDRTELSWAGAKFVDSENSAMQDIIRPDFTAWFNSRKGLEFRAKQGIN